MPTKRDCSDHKLLRFSNCSLLRHHHIICDDLWVRDGKILDPEKVFFDERIRADVIVDCCGLLIAPGFIDVQINGMIMQLFMSIAAVVEALQKLVFLNLPYMLVGQFSLNVISCQRIAVNFSDCN